MAEALNFQIIGDTSQILEVNLEPQRKIIGDGGALLFIDEEVSFETQANDGADELDQADLRDEEPEEDPEDEESPEPLEEEADDASQEGTLLTKLFRAAQKRINQVGQNIKKPEAPDAPKEENLEEMMDEFIAEEGDIGEADSWFITHFHNESEYIRKVAFTTANSGVIVHVPMYELNAAYLIIQTGTFLCASKGIRIEKHLDSQESITFTREKFYNLDKLSGQGDVFLQAEGQVISNELDTASIRINLFSLIAYESSLQLDLDNIQSVQSMRYEDDIQMVTLSGTGKYWLQAANLQQTVYRLSPFIFEDPSSGDEEGEPEEALPPFLDEGEGEGDPESDD